MKKNKIWLDSSFILKNKTGIGAYTLKIMQIVEKLDVDFLVKELNINLPYRYIWQTIWLNTVIYLETLIKKPDIFIFPNFIMPFFTRKKTKYVTVIYDLCSMIPNSMRKYNAFIFTLSIKIAIKKADTIVTDSQAVKDELIDRFGVDPNRIKVLYTTIPDYFKQEQKESNLFKKHNIEKQKYILSVATINKRKNIPELIKAFESISNKYPDLKLVLVGGMGNEHREKLTKHKNIIFTGYIPDEDIPALYRNALIYVFPSLYEGLGIPLIEAQYCDCPVVCSDIPVFREVGASAAEYCTPSAEGLAAQMDFLINNSARREELIKLGRENVKRFEPERIKEQIQGILKNYLF